MEVQVQVQVVYCHFKQVDRNLSWSLISSYKKTAQTKAKTTTTLRQTEQQQPSLEVYTVQPEEVLVHLKVHDSAIQSARCIKCLECV